MSRLWKWETSMNMFLASMRSLTRTELGIDNCPPSIMFKRLNNLKLRSYLWLSNPTPCPQHLRSLFHPRNPKKNQFNRLKLRKSIKCKSWSKLWQSQKTRKSSQLLNRMSKKRYSNLRPGWSRVTLFLHPKLKKFSQRSLMNSRYLRGCSRNITCHLSLPKQLQ